MNAQVVAARYRFIRYLIDVREFLLIFDSDNYKFRIVNKIAQIRSASIQLQVMKLCYTYARRAWSGIFWIFILTIYTFCTCNGYKCKKMPMLNAQEKSTRISFWHFDR